MGALEVCTRTLQYSPLKTNLIQMGFYQLIKQSCFSSDNSKWSKSPEDTGYQNRYLLTAEFVYFLLRIC